MAIVTFNEIHTLLKEYRRTRKGMKDKRNRHGAVGKSSSEQHFINLPMLPLLCEISGALHLVEWGLTAGWQEDKIQVNFEIFIVGCRLKYSTCCFVNEGTASLQPYQCIPAGFFR